MSPEGELLQLRQENHALREQVVMQQETIRRQEQQLTLVHQQVQQLREQVHTPKSAR
jgi:hypothetical protein